MTNARTRARFAAFTLLEVMMAMAILSICLAAVFSAEAGAIKMGTRARKTSAAVLLVRCKMGEIEEKIAKEGFPAVFASGQDKCCDDAPLEGYSCKWVIDPIIMPDTMFGDPSKNPLANGMGAPGAVPGANGTTPPALGATAAVLGGLPPTGAIPATGATPPLPGQPGAGPSPTDILSQDPSQMLQGGTGGPVDSMAQMAMQFVYPALKASFESQIRRATVTITWSEGSAQHQFDVTQYLVADQAATPDPNALLQAAGAGTTSGQTPVGGATATGITGGVAPAAAATSSSTPLGFR